MLADNEMRVIALLNVKRIIHGMFGGVVSGANGSVKVGGVELHPNEVAPAVALTLSDMKDAVEGEKDGGHELFSDPDYLDIRQEAMGEVVADLRQRPIPTAAR